MTMPAGLPLCECGHARRDHDTDPGGRPWFCMAEVPMGEGAYDGNVCLCMDYDPSEPLTCAVCHDTIPFHRAKLASVDGGVIALCPAHHDIGTWPEDLQVREMPR